MVVFPLGREAEQHLSADRPGRLQAVRQRLARLYEVSGARQRVLPMDGIRGLAVLLVFFAHYTTLFGDYVGDEPGTRAVCGFLGTVGHAGVDLFFGLSGYLIYGILISKPVGYFRFLWRRAKRIYPTFLCVLAAYVALSLALPGENKIPAGVGAGAWYLLANVALLPGMLPIPALITVAWSLSYEFFFYLTIPVIIHVTGMRRWRGRHRALFFGVLTLLYVGLCCLYDGPAKYARVGVFLAGILVYEALQWQWLRARLARAGDSPAVLAVLLSLALVYCVHAFARRLTFLPRLDTVSEAYHALICAVGCSILFVYAFGREGPLARVMMWAPLRWLGNMSYSYYLIHGLTLKAVALALGRLLPPSHAGTAFFWAILPFAFGATWLTATALYALVEKPFSLSAARPQTSARAEQRSGAAEPARVPNPA